MHVRLHKPLISSGLAALCLLAFTAVGTAPLVLAQEQKPAAEQAEEIATPDQAAKDADRAGDGEKTEENSSGQPEEEDRTGAEESASGDDAATEDTSGPQAGDDEDEEPTDAATADEDADTTPAKPAPPVDLSDTAGVDPVLLVLWRGTRQAETLEDLKDFFEATAMGTPVPPNLWPLKVFAQSIPEAGTLAGAQDQPGRTILSGTRLVRSPAPATPCDLAAAHPDDPGGFGPSVNWDDLEPFQAIAACARAVHIYPRDVRFQFQLARAYERADANTLAFRLYQLAARNGSSSAMVNLGLMYHAGRGVTQNVEKALDWYRKAADAGHPGAMFSLGLVYARGRGASKDPGEALRWFEMAAKLGLDRAMYSAGVMYAGGRGVPENADKAVNWFRMAADSGHSGAMNKLGMAFVSGSGGAKKDFEEAVHWYRVAAEQGDLPAMYNLALMYQRGWGEERNSRLASRWFRRAAGSGYERALERLENIAEVQSMLIDLGYDPGPADGLNGRKTREAISEFERKAKLKADGKPDPELVMALLADLKANPPDDAGEGAAKKARATDGAEAEKPDAEKPADVEKASPATGGATSSTDAQSVPVPRAKPRRRTVSAPPPEKPEEPAATEKPRPKEEEKPAVAIKPVQNFRPAPTN